MAHPEFFQNPYDGLEGPDRIPRDYKYETHRLADCHLLGPAGQGGIENLTMVEFDSKLWAYGGITHTGELSLPVLVYDIRHDSWRYGMSPTHPPARMCHTSVTYMNTMIVFGGTTQHEVLNDLWVYHFNLETWIPWTKAGESRDPPPRKCHGASVFGATMTVFGGLNGRGFPCEDMWTVSLAQNNLDLKPVWREIEYFGDLPENCQGAYATVNHYIFVWEWDTAVLSRFDYYSSTWTVVMYDEELEGHFLVCCKSSIFTFGGTVNDCLAGELKVWDTRNDDGRRFWLCDSEADEEPSPRRNMAGVAVGDAIFAFGGRDTERRRSDLWVIKSWEVDRDGVPIND